MNKVEKVLYVGKAKSTGGRDGKTATQSKVVDVSLTTPKELGGAGGTGTNPEELFAAGYSACFIGAMGRAASQMKIKLPADLALNTEVDLGTTDDAFFLQARLNVSLPGLDREVAQAVVEAAHQLCPYSKATRGNIHVELNLV